ncbi:protein CYSTEINE-RICH TRANSMEMBRANE MODULE 9-like [Rutidosis leptorrhynchoides]|uniref:protein CYSTEINE-RICH TRANSMEMBRANE MODULE 9-like n=1 Tax=Rutidosis leptorrhynchoides TaxID=125765 RepID=UPI003A99B3F6
MSSYQHNQPPQVNDHPLTHVEGGGGPEKDYVTVTPLPPPPATVHPPLKEGYESNDNNPPHGTQSRGDGFWRGCCAGMCCCCLLDICF